MDDERNFYLPDFLDGGDCGMGDDSFDDLKVKSGRDVDIINQLLQTGASFNGEKAKEFFGSAEPTIQEELPPTPEAQVEGAFPATSKAKRTKTLRHKCDTCSQVFDSRIALSIHSGRIHKSDGRDKNYQCHLCTKTFLNSSYLSQHMRIHTGLKPYECETCQKRFTQLSHLQQHKRTHSGEKPYRCKQPGCSKAFSQLSNLQSHTRSHLPDGNVHKCTSCYKCYFDEESLTTHLQAHMVNKRVRNYRCDVCGKTFTQDTYLQNHINNKHGGGSIEKMAYSQSPVTRQPTSIQAATSMICKVEEPVTPCTNGPLTSPLMQQRVSHPQGVMNKLLSSPGTLPSVGRSCENSGGYGTPEANYHRASVLPSVFPHPRREYEEHCSAFKPLPRPGLQEIESIVSQSQSRQRSVSGHTGSTTGYEQMNSSMLGMAAAQDATKNADVDRHPSEEQEMAYWTLRNNMAVAGLGPYPSLNSHIQSYMAGAAGGSYSSTYAAYMNSPLESYYAADKAAGLYSNHEKCDTGSAFDSDTLSDYLMGGLREAYSLD